MKKSDTFISIDRVGTRFVVSVGSHATKKIVRPVAGDFNTWVRAVSLALSVVAGMKKRTRRIVLYGEEK